MSEYGQIRRLVRCGKNACGLTTSVTEIGPTKESKSALRYDGTAECLPCGRRWTYSRAEGCAPTFTEIQPGG